MIRGVICPIVTPFDAQDRIDYASLRQVVFRDGVTPAYFKAGLRLRGVPAGRVRPPLRELAPEELAEVERGLRALELI